MVTRENYSSSFINVKQITEDLLKDIDLNGEEGVFGFLVCDSRIDYQSVVEELVKQVTYPIAGGTTLTMPSALEGEEISASFTVIQREGMKISVAKSAKLDVECLDEQMEQLYLDCVQDEEDIKLFMPFMPLIPGLPADSFIQSLFGKAGNIPVFGGVTTDDLDTTKAAVFTREGAFHNRMILIALSGNVKPVFQAENQLTLMSDYEPSVTESNHNIVKKVDDMLFCDYMKKVGIAPEERINGIDALIQYGPIPVRLRNKLPDDDGIPEIRCISYTNVEEGSVVFSSEMPEGTRVGLGILQKQDIIDSSRRCMDSMKSQIAENETDGYQYGMLFSFPCVARYFATTGGDHPESKLLRMDKPKEMAGASFYAFNEISPTLGTDKRVLNRSHNASIIMCAI